MAIFDDVSTADGGILQSVLRRNAADRLKLKAAIAEEEQKLSELYGEIGRKYFKLHGDDAEPELAEQVASAASFDTLISNYKEMLESIADFDRCPACGAEYDESVKACPVCGESYETEEEPVPEEDAEPIPEQEAEPIPEPEAEQAPEPEIEHPLDGDGYDAPKAPAPVMGFRPLNVSTKKICTNCGASVPADSKFCTVCGMRMPESKPAWEAPAAPEPAAAPAPQPAAPYCISCGAFIPSGSKFCTVCGKPVGEAEAPAKAEPAAPAPAPFDARPFVVTPPGAKLSDDDIPTMAFYEEPAAKPAPAAPEPVKAPEEVSPAAPAFAGPFCTGCGAPLSADSKFCTTCGKPVPVEPAPVMEEQAQEVKPAIPKPEEILAAAAAAAVPAEPYMREAPDPEDAVTVAPNIEDIPAVGQFTPAQPAVPADIPAPAAESEHEHCPQCGAEVHGKMRFCVQCGARIEQPTDQPEVKPAGESIPVPPAPQPAPFERPAEAKPFVVTSPDASLVDEEAPTVGYFNESAPAAPAAQPAPFVQAPPFVPEPAPQQQNQQYVVTFPTAKKSQEKKPVDTRPFVVTPPGSNLSHDADDVPTMAFFGDAAPAYTPAPVGNRCPNCGAELNANANLTQNEGF